jgi:hypothetical protein
VQPGSGPDFVIIPTILAIASVLTSAARGEMTLLETGVKPTLLPVNAGSSANL